MLKLYGFDVSNYYNMIKLAMAIKGIEYEAVTTYPNQSAEYLKISPMGKVPALQTKGGVLVETNVIIEYLDENYPGPSLYPTDPFQKARVKELVKMVELYLELPARRCMSEAFFGVPVADATKKEVKRALLNGIQGLVRVADFSPYLAGDELTAADIMFAYSADAAANTASKLFEIDLLAEAPGAKELLKKISLMPEAQQIAADRKAASPAFFEYVSKAYASQKG